MTGITYKVNGVELKASFDNMRDLTLFVAANRIKDEDLVSINLGDEDITGGIEGLANYTVDKITKEKEAEAKAAEIEEPYHLSDYAFEDKYYFVDQVLACDEDCSRIMFDDGESFIADNEKRVYIIKNGDEYENVYELDDAPIIRVRAKYIHEGDILVNM